MPKERLLAVALGRGPTGATLDLRHEHRAQPSSMDEIGRLLTNICQAIPQVRKQIDFYCPQGQQAWA